MPLFTNPWKIPIGSWQMSFSTIAPQPLSLNARWVIVAREVDFEANITLASYETSSQLPRTKLDNSDKTFSFLHTLFVALSQRLHKFAKALARALGWKAFVRFDVRLIETIITICFK
jgi:hypothetical protein